MKPKPQLRRLRLSLPTACLTLAVFAQARAQDFVLTDEQFNSWLGSHNASPTTRLESDLSVQILAIDRICQLASDQKAKLELAGRGDIARFDDRVAQLREELVGRTFSNEGVNEVWQRIQPLQQEMQQGILNDSSLFRKATHRTLQSEQLAEYQRVQARRRGRHYVAKVQLYIAMLEQVVPMSHQQRQDFVNLLLKETRPPMRFGQHDLYYVMHQAATIDRKKIKGIFDDAQWKVLEPALGQGAGYGNFLEQSGFVPQEEPADATADAKEAAAK